MIDYCWFMKDDGWWHITNEWWRKINDSDWCWMTSDIYQVTDTRCLMMDDGWLMSDDLWLMIEVRGQVNDVGCLMIDDGWQKTKGRWKMTNHWWLMTWLMTDDRRKITNDWCKALQLNSFGSWSVFVVTTCFRIKYRLVTFITSIKTSCVAPWWPICKLPWGRVLRLTLNGGEVDLFCSI